MSTAEKVVSIERRAGEGPGGTPLVVLAAYALPLALAATLLRPQMQLPWPERAYLELHLAVEVLAAVAAFGTFAVQWYAAGARLNDARARFIGAAFLLVGLFEVTHVLAFPGMPGLPWLGSSTERGIVYWLAARWCSVGALLGALAIPATSPSRLLRRGPLLALAGTGYAALLAADYLWISGSPRFYVEGVGLTPLKRAAELLVAGAAAAGLFAYRRAHRRRSDASADDLALALGLTVLSELSFALYARAYDSFNLLGHAYLLLATGWVFHALFAEAVLLPYGRLDASTRELAASNAELQRLREHVEGELAVTIRHLEAMHDQREDFVRAVSHDLRTPLQTILLQAERLLRISAPATRERSAGEVLSRAARQMSALIKDLVDSVYLESGALHLAREPLALKPFFEELLCADGAPCPERFSVEIPPDLPAISADAARLTRVVQNLAGNALKYSTPGTDIRVEARRVGDEVVVSVADRGAGIAPDEVPRLFERFYRGGQRGKAEGLGLGLYISRMIVAAHGGRIWCESTPGEGSTFRFSLPLGEAPSPDPGATA